mmetsp:Transcript_32950/g.54407  ORF Transcript_32950/g.54407 Transcript_32950/m.54407 type:complete len:180 (-) Transcript_32950:420-959(-)
MKNSSFIFTCLFMTLWSFALSKEPVLQLDESRVSGIGWTDAHHVAYGWPIRLKSGTEVMVQEADSFLESASDEFLCRQNDFGQTALHLAVRQDTIEIVSLYVRRGVCLNTANRDGDAPLHYAAFWGRLQAAKILLEAGAHFEQKNKRGNTPIDDARSERHEEVLLILESFRSDTARGEL